MKRRDLLKSLAGIPFLGAYGYLLFDKNTQEPQIDNSSFVDFLQKKLPDASQNNIPPIGSKKIRLGIIGTGSRGQYLMKALGFLKPQSIDRMNEQGRQLFNEQTNLNIEISAVCDLYSPRAKDAATAAANIDRKGSVGFKREPVKIYGSYQELLADPNIDAVVIATSDQWHAPITIAAAKAGKHVYCEKALTHNLEDVYKVRDAIKDNRVVFQLGHQNRQADNYIRARQVVKAGLLGKVNLVETSTNRNSPNGAWLYNIPKNASLQNLDWKQFVGDSNKPFNKEHFFRWRLFWDYGTGLSGDLLTHEFDCVNQVLEIGIPEKVSASGGIYHWKDNREVPDIFQVMMEYPNKGMSVMYSASLANSASRPRLIMGSDASLEIGRDVELKVEPRTELYNEFLKKKIIRPGESINLNNSSEIKLDAISSATERYFASRGLLYTSRNGKTMDTTHLHLAEWLHAIRSGSETSCHIDRAFEEGIVAQMATLSYREGKMKYWDGNKVI
ncbi:MAG: Gfo/Idh/MocA family oxidoreductase [Carboxylicivirga sp.]|jgi:predicted dehydrogenase|nr:Gfo/Idh/MocA family oxidoreductase [Carboxylicivirga sp.]